MNEKILVNKQHPLKEEKLSSFSFISTKNKLNEEIILEKKTYEAYCKLKECLAKEKIEIELVSGMRTFEEQQALLDEFAYLYGEDNTKKYVAPVGMSEHHTGLCFDISFVLNGKIIEDNDILLSDEFAPFFAKVIGKLSDFGLILRYPKGKENITGYFYEPWHYRYVGKKTARKIKEENLTLEEYTTYYQRSGILILDKKEGLTSRDVVNQVCNFFDTSKVGHNGTLDPLATGVLVITINKATRINELLTSLDKEYLATVQVGKQTDTGDITGTVEKEEAVTLTKKALEKVFFSFPKEYLQEVPKYAAVKINGKKLYEYARNKEEVSLPKRMVRIDKLELQHFTPNEFTFLCHVSKGCYIRSLIQDIGEKLQVPLTMSALRRTSQGMFSLDQAISFEALTVDTPLLSIEEVLPYPIIEVDEALEKKIRNGAPIEAFQDEDMVLFKKDKTLLALYKRKKDKLRAYKMFL